MNAQTPTRREWHGTHDSGNGKIHVQSFSAFGWKIHRHVMTVGSALHTNAEREIDRSKAANLTLYVRGRATLIHEDGTALIDRVPGIYSGDRPNTPAGRLTHTVLEELEFWCFNWTANRNALPEVTVFRTAPGETLNVSEGQRVLLCHGSLGSAQAPAAFLNGPTPLIANTQCYGFLIGGDRA